jgi:hypothetical protein
MSSLSIDQINKMTTGQIQEILAVKFKFKGAPQYIEIPDSLIKLADTNQKTIDTKKFNYVEPNTMSAIHVWVPTPFGSFTHNNKLIKALLEYEGTFKEAKLPSNGGSKRRMRRRIRRKSRKNLKKY